MAGNAMSGPRKLGCCAFGDGGKGHMVEGDSDMVARCLSGGGGVG